MNTITIPELRAKMQSGLESDELILDVREPEEFSSGHIPGARNFPLSQLEQNWRELGRYRRIYVHCQAGKRAQMASQFLIQQGIQTLVCISDGGFANWKSAGYPTQN